jgi:hypothetical protein
MLFDGRIRNPHFAKSASAGSLLLRALAVTDSVRNTTCGFL